MLEQAGSSSFYVAAKSATPPSGAEEECQAYGHHNAHDISYFVRKVLHVFSSSEIDRHGPYTPETDVKTTWNTSVGRFYRGH